jgi:hypothetical protein
VERKNMEIRFSLNLGKFSGKEINDPTLKIKPQNLS